MKRIFILFLILASFAAARAQFAVHGGYSLVVEQANDVVQRGSPSSFGPKTSKTNIFLHGGHLGAYYNFRLVGQLGLSTGFAIQMTMMTQNTVTSLRSKETQSRAKAVVVNPNFQEYDISAPVHLNYTFDPTSQLHFVIFVGPRVGLVFGEMKGVRFDGAYYKDAAYHRTCAVNLAIDMGLEFRFRQFGLCFTYSQEMLSSGHRFWGKHRIKRDMLTLGVAYHFEKFDKKEK